MKRAFNPVPLDADGVPILGCGGSCNQGRAACDCELANGIPPDASRTFAPAPSPEPHGWRRWLAVLSVALIAFGLLVCMNAPTVHVAVPR